MKPDLCCLSLTSIFLYLFFTYDTLLSFTMKLFILLCSVALSACQPTLTLEADPADPTPTGGDVKGSSQCRVMDQDECNKAMEVFEDAKRYEEYTFEVAAVLTLFTPHGCKVEYYCDNADDYGITGKGIKAA